MRTHGKAAASFKQDFLIISLERHVIASGYSRKIMVQFMQEHGYDDYERDETRKENPLGHFFRN